MEQIRESKYSSTYIAEFGVFNVFLGVVWFGFWFLALKKYISAQCGAQTQESKIKSCMGMGRDYLS